VRLEPAVLEGEHVRLEPAGDAHVDGLWHAGRFPELWDMRPFPVYSRDEMLAQVRAARATDGGGGRLMFATIDRASGRIVGSTRYLSIDPVNRRLEIGGTWLPPAWQRTPVNSEAKFLQLEHCFETLGCVRVEFKTDARNARSRAALARIGATEEGTLRRHLVLPDGHVRDSVYFSILDDEWPEVRDRLRAHSAAYPPFDPPADW
jgi:N-acetyltransferase